MGKHSKEGNLKFKVKKNKKELVAINELLLIYCHFVNINCNQWGKKQ